MSRRVRVLNMIDDVWLAMELNPVLAIRVSRRHGTPEQLKEMTLAWWRGEQLPSWAGAFVPSTKVMARRARRRR